MNSLYEIDGALLQLIEQGFTYDCINLETGEIDEEKIQRYLTELPIERSKKLEAYGCLIKNLTAEAEAIKNEEKALAARRQAKENTIERLKANVAASMQIQGETKFETPKVVFSFRKSEVVEVDSVDKLPDEYVTVKTTTTPDKAAIKAALKGGKVIEGASLITRQNLQIK